MRVRKYTTANTYEIIVVDNNSIDEQFTPGNFEDDDLSMRIIESGYKLMLCHDSFIHHFGGTSFKKDYVQFQYKIEIIISFLPYHIYKKCLINVII